MFPFQETQGKKEGVHQSSNTRHANAHSTNDEDTPENIGRTFFVLCCIRNLAFSCCISKKDTNIYLILF